MENSNTKNKIVLMIFVALISILGGTLGGLIYGNWLGEWRSTRDASNETSLNNNATQVIIRDAKKVTVQQDTQVTDVLANTERVMMGIFKASPSVGGQNYDLTTPLASGVVITSDGWLVVDWPKAESLGANLSSFVAISKDKKTYQLEKVVADNFSGLVFVRLKGANSLPVANFAKALELKRGQAVVTLLWMGEARLSIINQFVRSANPNFSDNPFKQIVVNDAPANALLAVDLSGKVAGWKRGANFVTVDYITMAIDYLLNNQKISPTSLGVNYTDLDYVFSGKQIFGALITKDKKGIAVIKGGVAEKAGLKEGDIITAIDEQELGRGISLSDVVATYQQGQKVTIKYLRGTDNKEVNVELK
jgi:putative serine protease PepD